ncbi:MAG: hypothetical protein HRU46_18380, partial [Verrucomicrobiales bacterium]|nr:hypothetical protein [Verrucomicrobiales bacterium]
MFKTILSILVLVVGLATLASGEGSALPDGKGLDELRQRSQAALKRQAEFVKGVQDGSIDRFADLRSKWPELEKQVAELKRLQEGGASGGSDSERLSKELFEGLQSVGTYLETAYVPDEVALNIPRFSDEQVAEINRVTNEMQDAEPAEPNAAGGPKMRLIGSNTRYTLLFLSVPIEVQAPAGSPVYFYSSAGGRFLSNKIAVKKVIADDNGVASVQWVSEGGASGEAAVEVLCPEAVNQVNLLIKVVDLRLEIPKGFT